DGVVWALVWCAVSLPALWAFTAMFRSRGGTGGWAVSEGVRSLLESLCRRGGGRGAQCLLFRGHRYSVGGDRGVHPVRWSPVGGCGCRRLRVGVLPDDRIAGRAAGADQWVGRHRDVGRGFVGRVARQ